MKAFTKTMLLVSLSFVALVSLCLTAVAQKDRDRKTKKVQEAATQSAKAARVFKEIMGTSENSLPRDLLDRAEAVAVFPSVLKAGFLFGGRGWAGAGRPQRAWGVEGARVFL